MLMTTVVLRAPDARTHDRPDPQLLASLVRAVASPRDGLEHVAVRETGRAIELVLFQTVREAPLPPATGAAICRRALRLARQLSDWTVGTEQQDIAPTLRP